VRRIPGTDRRRQVLSYPSHRSDVEVALVPGAARRIQVGDDELLRRDRRRFSSRQSQLVSKDGRPGDRQDDEGNQRGVETLTPSAPSS
jgi:hypothetical protein